MEMDYKNLSDEELGSHHAALQLEVERRNRLAAAVDMVTATASRYAADGGDISVLADALTASTETTD